MQLQPGLLDGVLTAFEPDTASFATRIASYCFECAQSKKATNIGDLLRRSFSLKHREIGNADGDATQLEEDDDEAAGGNNSKAKRPSQKKPECWQIGVCVCSEQGQQLYRLKQRFINVIKAQFPASGEHRHSLLKASRVFILLRGCVVEEASKESPQFTIELLLHVGIQYLTPFRPTFREVVASGDVNAAAVPIIGTNNYSTIWPTLEKLSLDLAWFARFYMIRETAMPSGSFQPAKATILPLLPGDVGKQFWPPTRSTRRGKAAPDLDSDPDDKCDNDGVQAESEDELDDLLGSLDAMMKANDAADDDGDGGQGKDDQDSAAAASDANAGPNDSEDGSSSSSSSSSSSDSSSSSHNRTLRGSADIAVSVPGGVLRFYANKNAFVATCSNPAHGKCEKTRQSTLAAKVTGNSSANVLAKGRPLGYLTAWLAMGHHAVDKEQHWDPEHAPSHPTRAAARAALAAVPRGDLLLAKERAPRPGEGSEPAGLP